MSTTEAPVKPCGSLKKKFRPSGGLEQLLPPGGTLRCLTRSRGLKTPITLNIILALQIRNKKGKACKEGSTPPSQAGCDLLKKKET